MRRNRLLAVTLALVLTVILSPYAQQARAIPNPIATTDAEYLAYGRVFPDPQGCLAHDTDGDGVNDAVPPNVSPWAKGNVCVAQFLTFQEAVQGSQYLARRYPRFVQVIRLDQAYDNGNFMSAGIPRAFSLEDGLVRPIDRDRRPLYLLKITDSQSAIPEPMRLHFVYALSIHGIERAGAEGGLRAMEDLVTWAATSPGKPIVETATEKPVPNAGDTLSRSVVYFMLANPDGWSRGEAAPAELEDGSPNLQYTPGAFYQRYNGNGMDLNRDWPGVGYSYKPYSPASEPEVKAYMHALRGIRANISPNNPVGQRFAGGIDLHGQLIASAFSYTLLGAGQRDFRKNFSTVDQGLRTWEDQTARLAWSPYIGTPIAPVADQWGTVIDTLGYQVSGALGDWIENEEIGLGAVGIDNEMSISHIAPNNVYEPTIEQMHIDGNKGLIYSQLASMLTEQAFRYEPVGKIGYVLNPIRITNAGEDRVPNPGLPAQNDINLILPSTDPNFQLDGTAYNLEFEVRGPNEGIWNGGITATMTNANATGISTGTLSRLSLQKWDDDMETWENIATAFVQAGTPDLYLQSGQVVTTNDPMPGLWRVRVTNGGGTGAVRVKVDFNPVSAELTSGQDAFSVSSMDFFGDLNRYIPDPADHAEAVTIDEILASAATLDRFDSLVVVNTIGRRSFLMAELGLTAAQADAYYAALNRFAEVGGNLVLTDAALSALGDMGVVPSAEIRDGLASTTGRGQAASYNFSVSGRGNTCNVDPLTLDVCLPGTAGGNTRVAVEPTPLGYPPDGTLDNEAAARMRQWWVQRAAWENGCGKENAVECTSALMLGGQAGIGERHVGDGIVRIVGAMFPDASFRPNAVRDMRFGLQSYALSFSAWQIFLNLVDYQAPERPSETPDLEVTSITTQSKVGSGDNAVVTATVTNSGTAGAAASVTEFVLDGETELGSVDTPSITAGGSVDVQVNWNTAGVKGQHVISVAADAGQAIGEADEANNLATLEVSVKGNRVTNGSFEQPNAGGDGPAGWTTSSTAAGEAGWSQDEGTDGSPSAIMSGTGGNAALAGSPRWTSDPVAVSAGEVLELSASVSVEGASSAPSIGVVYLGAAGTVVDSVKVLTAPLTTNGFETLSRTITVPAGATDLRVVLTAFAPTDLRTTGQVTFDDVSLLDGT